MLCEVTDNLNDQLQSKMASWSITSIQVQKYEHKIKPSVLVFPVWFTRVTTEGCQTNNYFKFFCQLPKFLVELSYGNTACKICRYSKLPLVKCY